MTTPNRPPLWEVLRNARFDVYRKVIGQPTEEEYAAAQIRALRDWLVPEEDLDLRPPTDGGLIASVEWCVGKERQRLRALLTTEADRAERGIPDDLSPAAQVVWDAAWNLSPVNCESHEDRRRRQIAAALRAAADQVTPELGCTVYGLTTREHERQQVRRELLAIAAELDPQ